MYQFTASPLSNNEGKFKAACAGLLGRLKAHMEWEGGVGSLDI